MATIFIETKSNITETEFDNLMDTLRKRNNDTNEFIVYPGTTEDMQGYKLHVILAHGEKLVSVNGVSDVCIETEEPPVSKLKEFFNPKIKAKELEKW